jgi:hypothetical protein
MKVDMSKPTVGCTYVLLFPGRASWSFTSVAMFSSVCGKSSIFDNTGWDVVSCDVPCSCWSYGGSLTVGVVSSPFLLVVEENFPFFEGKMTLVEVDAVAVA